MTSRPGWHRAFAPIRHHLSMTSAPYRAPHPAIRAGGRRPAAGSVERVRRRHRLDLDLDLDLVAVNQRSGLRPGRRWPRRSRRAGRPVRRTGGRRPWRAPRRRDRGRLPLSTFSPAALMRAVWPRRSSAQARRPRVDPLARRPRPRRQRARAVRRRTGRRLGRSSRHVDADAPAAALIRTPPNASGAGPGRAASSPPPPTAPRWPARCRSTSRCPAAGACRTPR